MEYKAGDKVTLACSKERFISKIFIGERTLQENFNSKLVATIEDIDEGVNIYLSEVTPPDSGIAGLTSLETQYIKPLEEPTMYTKENLTPVTEKEQMLTMALLRKIRGQGLESYQGRWVEHLSNHIRLDEEYRKLVEKTPLDLPWKFIKKEFKYAAMDEDGFIYLYQALPRISSGKWLVTENCCTVIDSLDIKTEGVNWELSLTKRPEDV